MNRDKLISFVLGFVAGVLFMLLAGGTVGGLLTYTMYQRAQREREAAVTAQQEAMHQREIAEEQAQRAREAAEEARLQEQKARQQVEEALEAERRRQKP